MLYCNHFSLIPNNLELDPGNKLRVLNFLGKLTVTIWKINVHFSAKFPLEDFYIQYFFKTVERAKKIFKCILVAKYAHIF